MADHSWESAVSWLTSQPEYAQLVCDCYFDQPISDAAFRYWQSQEWQALRSWLPQPTGRALDLGAGNGIASYALSKDGWEVSALEPDPSDLVGRGAIQQLVAQTGLSIEVFAGFGESLPFPDNCFDLVLARQALHHASDLGMLCREIQRVLKPSGYLLAVREHVISSEQDLKIFLDTHPLHHLYGGENAYTCSEYVKALKNAGLKIRKIVRSFESPVNYYPQTRSSIVHALITKLAPTSPRLSTLFERILLNEFVFARASSLISFVDRRPGRLFSFICQKPDS